MKMTPVLVIIGVVVLTGIYLGGYSESSEDMSSGVVPTKSEVNESIVSPDTNVPTDNQNQPSGKALKIVAFGVARTSKDVLIEAKKRLGNVDMTNVEFIRLMAFKLDADPALMADQEARVQKIMAQEGQPIQNSYYEQQTGTTTDTFEQDRQRRRSEEQQECQKEMTEYNSCIGKYNTELGEYNNCLLEGRKYQYCSKPNNFCSKPFCSSL
ncbi:MAG: hypothetical protein UU73_C0005G0015 [Candidatus Daviesbacteria bacterium GW2011_GWA1_41_61]|uniref:Uncharacterized protein n=1 Tax=Candidatus Daviesbacteria bacterium GW2011_GWA2_40_9 TaxID=1618424 RepID=A0A0G0U8U4_9BACT|nr:MAG: hypothetical protein UU29_C0003G0058 [Candidatus Daviesbacteria bacterium GW2011_GWA2_40_9]KKR92685.1 MAG: hypothetical protein UU44_C0005G0015 [Candidatus Daviesbacteria bacterium GW2011_GWB1_41_15]KKS14616.1 MAG: hypothetical protein UU73_C0005G0015 [Candidatus Daviesbacteria bacterium GW2011_GWA1_41_61]